MLKPDYLLHISEGTEEISEVLHNEIIKRIINRIMLRISRNDDYILTAYDKWNIETLQQAGYLLEDIQKEIAKATKLEEKEIAEAMEEAGVEALSYDDKIYESVGLSPTPLTQSPELIRLMQRNYEATLGEWHNFTRTTAEISQQLFINQLDRFYMLVSTGAMGYTQALKEIIDTVVSDGVRVYYDTGHSDTIETATLRAVRTGISQMSAQIQIKRMDEMDVDLVITSSHLGARPTHQEWQGKIFSRSGSKKYPDFVESTSYGSVEGLCGANCRHSFSPYFEGMDNPFEQYDSEENLEQYEKEQRQRTLERRIRKTKREVMGWKEAVDAETDDKAKFELDLQYQKKASLLQKQNEAYKDYCEKNNLRPLADRITIARWNRQQAAAARGAAKRYENAHGGSIDKSEVKKVVENTSKTTIITAKNIVGDWKPSGNYDFAIEDVINTQGFNGLPEVVDYNKFEEAMKKSNFYAERTYSADTQELLDTYQNELYNGKWYVDCSEGGAQYGQGMYCASCYDISDNTQLGGIGNEMSHYKQIGISKGKKYSYVEAITLKSDAKILELPHGAKAEEYISEVYRNEYLKKFATKSQIEKVKEYIKYNTKIMNLTFDEDSDFIDDLYRKRAEATKGIEDLLKNSLSALEDVSDGKKYHGLKNPGVLAAEMGYDAINAIGHGQSGSYTVILNRTKVIICKGGSIYGN